MVSSPALEFEDLRQIISNYIIIKMKVNGVQCFVSLNGQFFYIYIYIFMCVPQKEQSSYKFGVT